MIHDEKAATHFAIRENDNARRKRHAQYEAIPSRRKSTNEWCFGFQVCSTASQTVQAIQLLNVTGGTVHKSIETAAAAKRQGLIYTREKSSKKPADG